jgi:oxygen-dependent protoporphyrinogen oxidase
VRVVVVGGGVAGLAAARRLEQLLPDVEIVLVERAKWLGGKLLTERTDGFVIEAAPDSFLTRKERGTALCEELGLRGELIGRRPENARSFVRRGDELLPLPEGLTGMIPTNLDALAESPLLTEAGKRRLAAETDVPPAPPGGDESIAGFVSRRLGREAYEAFIEPLMTGIYGGDGDQLSLESTFPQLRALELAHGSVLRGLLAQPRADSEHPAFLSLRGGMAELVAGLRRSLARTSIILNRAAVAIRTQASGYAVELRSGEQLYADGVVVAVPAFAAAELLASLDRGLADAHAEIPYASSVVVSLAYDEAAVAHPLDGYGYVVPHSEESDVLACTWSSSKWGGRAPTGHALLRVYAGRFGGRDVTTEVDDDLVELAREELRLLGITTEPSLARVHRWPRGMPQYVLGHPDRLVRIENALEEHPGLALAGAAYRGVGIPDCIRSGEDAAQSLARSLAPVSG